MLQNWAIMNQMGAYVTRPCSRHLAALGKATFWRSAKVISSFYFVCFLHVFSKVLNLWSKVNPTLIEHSLYANVLGYTNNIMLQNKK